MPIDWPNDLWNQLQTEFGLACPELLVANGGGGIWHPTPVMRQKLDAIPRPYGIIALNEAPYITQGTGRFGFQVFPSLTVGYSDPENEAGVNLAVCKLIDHFSSILSLANNYTRQGRCVFRPPDADPWNDMAAKEHAQVIFASAQFSFLCDAN